MGRKAIEKRDNQLIINIDEIEREQQALMLTKSNDLIHAKFNASLFVQKLLNFSLASIAKQRMGRYPARCEWQTCGAMDLSGHSIYTAVSAAVEPILNFKIIKYDDAAEKIIGLNIVTDCYYSDGILYTTFNRKIEADVINIQKKFTRNNVYFLCKFKSAYSLRLYELLSTQRWVLQKSKKKIVSVYILWVNCVLRWVRSILMTAKCRRQCAGIWIGISLQKKWQRIGHRSGGMILRGVFWWLRRKKLIMLTIRILGLILNRSKVGKAIKLHR